MGLIRMLCVPDPRPRSRAGSQLTRPPPLSQTADYMPWLDNPSPLHTRPPRAGNSGAVGEQSGTLGEKTRDDAIFDDSDTRAVPDFGLANPLPVRKEKESEREREGEGERERAREKERARQTDRHIER